MGILHDIRVFVTGLLARIGLDGRSALVGLGLFLVTFFGSIALTAAVLVRLPADYLTDGAPARFDPRHPKAYLLRLARHLIGILLILVGLVLSVPGVPGQGVLTILAGLFISELPGTRRLLRRILRAPRVLSAVNKLRARYEHPPLLPPAPPGPALPPG